MSALTDITNRSQTIQEQPSLPVQHQEPPLQIMIPPQPPIQPMQPMQPMKPMQPMQWFPGMPTVSGSVSLEPYGQNQHPFFPQQYAYPPQYPYGMPSTPVAHQPPSCVTSTPAANPPKNMDNIIHEMDMSVILQLPVNQDNCQENQENQPMETAADTTRVTGSASRKRQHPVTINAVEVVSVLSCSHIRIHISFVFINSARTTFY